MIYLSEFGFLERENDTINSTAKSNMTCFNSYYPYKILSRNDLSTVTFEPVTIFYGSNGSGKTTALNVIAEKLRLKRETMYNSSTYFNEYVGKCDCERAASIPKASCIITSDDVFDYMMNLRAINKGIDYKREDLFEEFTDLKYSGFKMKSIEDYEKLKKVNCARSSSKSKYVKNNLMANVREHSNGESAYKYFVEKITEEKLYLLDEPENSLAPELQIKLAQFLEDSARFYKCQLIIATHSPFVLSIKGAKIYDLDASPVSVKKWSELPNVRTYYDFFKKHEKDFA